jgi:hypothetical protein
MFANTFAIGCCACSPACSGSIYLPVSVCCQADTDPGFPTVTCVGPLGGSVPYAAGHASLTEGSGDYVFTITQTGYYSRTYTVDATCGLYAAYTTIYLRPTSLTFDCASLCSGLNGSTLTLGGAYSGTSVSVSGDGAQTVVVDVPDISGTGIPPDYTATLSQDRYVDLTITYCRSDDHLLVVWGDFWFVGMAVLGNRAGVIPQHPGGLLCLLRRL